MPISSPPPLLPLKESIEKELNKYYYKFYFPNFLLSNYLDLAVGHLLIKLYFDSRSSNTYRLSPFTRKWTEYQKICRHITIDQVLFHMF